MKIESIIMLVLLSLILVAVVTNLIITILRKRGVAVGQSDEDTDLISRNIFEAKDVTVAEIKKEIETMTKLLETAYNSTTSANTQNWQMLMSAVNNNFTNMNEHQQNSLKGMVDVIDKAMKSEQENGEKLHQSLLGFIEQVNNKLMNISKEVTTSLMDVRDKNEKQLNEIRVSNEKSLDVMRATVDEKLTKTLNERLEQSFNTISERLESVHKGLGEMRILSDSVGSLNRVLNNAKVRGNWGEVALDSLLEQMLSPEQYDRQFRLDDKREAVDFVVKMPGRVKGDKLYLPIDSKFPFDDYEAMIEAVDNGDKASLDIHTKNLETRIKKEAKSISDKYIMPPLTTNFAIMYLPIEGLFAEVVKRPGLCRELQNTYRVVVAGPTTITALLNSLQLGFKTLAVQEKSLEVWKALAVFKKEFTKFADSIDKTQKKIDEASTSLSDATKRTDKIKRKLDQIENDTPDELLEDTMGKEVGSNEG